MQIKIGRKRYRLKRRFFIAILLVAIMIFTFGSCHKIADLSTENTECDTGIEMWEKQAHAQGNRPIQVSLGEYEITHYCVCEKCCGKKPHHPAYGITATGTVATEGRTIAVDPKVIPYGTKVVIDGHEYIAEDCGGGVKGNRIDIYLDSHQEAINRGRIKRECYIYK